MTPSPLHHHQKQQQQDEDHKKEEEEEEFNLEDRISLAETKISELYQIRSTYFGADKQERMERIASDICDRLLPEVPLSSSAEVDAREGPASFATLPAKFRPVVCFLRGRTLDAFPTYSAEAEECLSRAVSEDHIAALCFFHQPQSLPSDVSVPFLPLYVHGRLTNPSTTMEYHLPRPIDQF